MKIRVNAENPNPFDPDDDEEIDFDDLDAEKQIVIACRMIANLTAWIELIDDSHSGLINALSMIRTGYDELKFQGKTDIPIAIDPSDEWDRLKYNIAGAIISAIKEHYEPKEPKP